MAKLLKLRRGTTSQHSSFTGAEGEVTVDTDKETLVVHDGSTAGGHPVAAEDMANVSSASIAGRLANDSLATSKLAAGALPSDVTVASANLVDGTIVNADVNASAAIAGTKISPDFGSQNITTTGTIGSSGDITITNDIPRVNFVDSGDNPDWEIGNINGAFRFRDTTNSATWMQINTDGHVDINGNLDVGSGVDVTGAITSTGNITVTNDAPKIFLTDGSNNPDFSIQNANGAFVIFDDTNSAVRLEVNSDGHVDVKGNLDCEAGVDVTGNITCTGTVDGVNIGGQNTLMRSVVDSTGVIADDVTTNTQAAGNNSTRLATTAFVTTAISNADAFPSGTKMIFQQTAAPTGWTKVTSDVDNKALRVVSGTAGSGGSNAFSNTLADRGITANAANSTQSGNISVANTTAGGNVSISSTSTSGTVNSHTLSTNEMPSHSHGMQFAASRTEYRSSGGPGVNGVSWVNQQNQYRQSQGSQSNIVQYTGGGGGHSHGFSGGSHTHTGTLSGSAHTHNATFSGSAHNHSITVGNLDMAVQYLDVIIASKD